MRSVRTVDQPAGRSPTPSVGELRAEVQDSRDDARETLSAVKETLSPGAGAPPVSVVGEVATLVRVARVLKRHSLTAMVVGGVVFWALQTRRSHVRSRS